MKISVVIPMYNSEETIISTLESVKIQTAYGSILEVIVVNDGSTDKSLKKLEEYKKNNPNIPIIVIDKKNGGVSSARNAGMKIAKGDFIALLDSDDVWMDNKLERQIEILNDNPHIDFLGCDSSEKCLRILNRKIDKLYKANIKDLCIKCFPSTPCAIFKKSIIEKVGYFNENKRYGEDMNYFNKICINFNYYHLPEHLVYIGHGKPAFGFSGLSANLKGMHEGHLDNLKELKKDGYISNRFYLTMKVFYWVKYFRRIIITKLRNNKV